VDVSVATAGEYDVPTGHVAPGRSDRRRNAKKSCCVVCDKPMAVHDRMSVRIPDPRRQNWGLMTQGDAHPRCVANLERRRAEAAEQALAALSQAAKAQHATDQTADRAQAAGLWLPNRGAA
jgi:hypothetical protein